MVLKKFSVCVSQLLLLDIFAFCHPWEMLLTDIGSLDFPTLSKLLLSFFIKKFAIYFFIKLIVVFSHHSVLDEALYSYSSSPFLWQHFSGFTQFQMLIWKCLCIHIFAVVFSVCELFKFKYKTYIYNCIYMNNNA